MIKLLINRWFRRDSAIEEYAILHSACMKLMHTIRKTDPCYCQPDPTESDYEMMCELGIGDKSTVADFLTLLNKRARLTDKAAK